MKLAFSRFEQAAATDSPAPDFAVLLAGLSAHQSASTTAKHQILLENCEKARGGEPHPPIDLFMRNAGSPGAPMSGSFNADVARSLSEDFRK